MFFEGYHGRDETHDFKTVRATGMQATTLLTINKMVSIVFWQQSLQSQLHEKPFLWFLAHTITVPLATHTNTYKTDKESRVVDYSNLQTL